MIDSIFLKGEKRMDEVLDLVSRDLMNIQTGRAKPALIESIKVEAYEGSYMEVRELASITAPDLQTILIKPWDPTVVSQIEKAIQKSDLQLQPIVTDGQVRIKIPALTTDRRQELVKVIKQKIEAGKAMIRQVRLEMKKEIDRSKDDDGVSEDDIHIMYDKLQDQINRFNKKLEGMEELKEKELMSL